MRKHIKLVLLGATLAATSALHAQQIPDFSVDGRPVHVHAFVSQGYAASDQNNFLTMNTSAGKGSFTDFGFNVSTQLTDKFRVGAQMYDRNIGNIGNWHPTLDWAFGDYKFKDWFGVRAGKVKTALGLFNDTQDMEFLHTWALLPQSVYPTDLRSSTISHTGGDVYGNVSLHHYGSLDYTAYAGTRPDDPYGGYYLNAATLGTPIRYARGKAVGTDVRWTTPITDLMVGTSWMNQWLDIAGTLHTMGDLPFTGSSAHPERILSGYADYTVGKLHFDTEFRRNSEILDIVTAGVHAPSNAGDKEFFASVAYRLTKRLELGTYNSRFYIDVPTSPESAANHIFDQVIAARVDVTKCWNVKVEGHFMDGYGSLYSAHSFYLIDNPNGLKPTTNMLVLRTGFNF
jgi:hypothetical protein